MSASYSESARTEGHALVSEQVVVDHLIAWNFSSIEKAAEDFYPGLQSHV